MIPVQGEFLFRCHSITLDFFFFISTIQFCSAQIMFYYAGSKTLSLTYTSVPRACGFYSGAFSCRLSSPLILCHRIRFTSEAFLPSCRAKHRAGMRDERGNSILINLIVPVKPLRVYLCTGDKWVCCSGALHNARGMRVRLRARGYSHERT